MLIEIESYTGDCLLCGKPISFGEFKMQIAEIEKEYDKNENNFIAMLCRKFQWEIASQPDKTSAEFVYDRDTRRTYIVKG